MKISKNSLSVFVAFTIHQQVGLSFDHDTAGSLNVPSVVPKLSWGSGEMSVGGFDVEVRLTILLITRVLVFGRKWELEMIS